MESTLFDTHMLVAKLDKHPWIKERIEQAAPSRLLMKPAVSNTVITDAPCR